LLLDFAFLSLELGVLLVRVFDESVGLFPSGW
jgi:hypothetical protein